MITEQVAEQIIRKIVELANQGENILFERDLGGNTLTIWMNERHTHVGIPKDDEAAFSVLLDTLLAVLEEREGLSWA